MDRDMRLRKVCPQCNTVVHVKRSCCGCGHVFTLKRKVQVSADKSMGKAVKRRRALETVEDTLRRQNRTRMASMRASETHKQTLQRQEQDRICTASMINPRRACVRVTVLVLSVCLSVCLCVCFPYSGTSRNQAYKQQYQRLQRDTGMKYKKGFFFKTLRSEVMASFTHLE